MALFSRIPTGTDAFFFGQPLYLARPQLALACPILCRALRAIPGPPQDERSYWMGSRIRDERFPPDRAITRVRLRHICLAPALPVQGANRRCIRASCTAAFSSEWR